jgi:hypothetical protein
MSKITIRATNLKVNSALKVHKNSVWLGYVTATLAISAGDVEIFSIRIRNMKCTEFASGLHIEFDGDEIQVWSEKEQKMVTKLIPHVYTSTAISRKRFTACMFAALKVHHKAHYSKAA